MPEDNIGSRKDGKKDNYRSVHVVFIFQTGSSGALTQLVLAPTCLPEPFAANRSTGKGQASSDSLQALKRALQGHNIYPILSGRAILKNPANKDQGSWHATILGYGSQVYHTQQAVEICALRRILVLKLIVRVSLVSHWLDHDHFGKERSSLEQSRETIAAGRTWPSGGYGNTQNQPGYHRKHHPSSFAGGVLLGVTRYTQPYLPRRLRAASWRKEEQTFYALEKPRYPPLSSFEEDRTRSVCLGSAAASNLKMQLSKA